MQSNNYFLNNSFQDYYKNGQIINCTKCRQLQNKEKYLIITKNIRL